MYQGMHLLYGPPQYLTSITSPIVFHGAQGGRPTHGRITTCIPRMRYGDLPESGPPCHHSGVPSRAWFQNNGYTSASKVAVQIVS